jgi:hypothetical protein
MTLLDGLNYQLVTHNPYRALRGFVGDLSKKGKECSANKRMTEAIAKEDAQDAPEQLLWREPGRKVRMEQLHLRAREHIKRSLNTDCMLLFSPAQIALAALELAAEDILAGENDSAGLNAVRSYVERRFGDGAAASKIRPVVDSARTLMQRAAAFDAAAEGPGAEAEAVRKKRRRRLAKVDKKLSAARAIFEAQKRAKQSAAETDEHARATMQRNARQAQEALLCGAAEESVDGSGEFVLSRPKKMKK